MSLAWWVAGGKKELCPTKPPARKEDLKTQEKSRWDRAAALEKQGLAPTARLSRATPWISPPQTACPNPGPCKSSPCPSSAHPSATCSTARMQSPASSPEPSKTTCCVRASLRARRTPARWALGWGGPRLGPVPRPQAETSPPGTRDKAQEVGPQGPDQSCAFDQLAKQAPGFPLGELVSGSAVGLRKLHFQDTSLGDSGWVVWQC